MVKVASPKAAGSGAAPGAPGAAGGVGEWEIPHGTAHTN